MSDVTDAIINRDSQPSLRGEEIKRQLERRSHDKVLVVNPTDQDFTLTVGGFKHIIPNVNRDMGDGKGKRILERFLAERYLKHMTDKVIITKIDNAVENENASRVSRGALPMTLYQEQTQFENGVARLSDEDLRNKIMASLYGGVVEEFGMDSAPTVEKRRSSTASGEFAFMAEADKRTNIVPNTVVEEEKDSEFDRIKILQKEAVSNITE